MMETLEVKYHRTHACPISEGLDLQDAIIQPMQSQQWSNLKTYNMIFFPMTDKIIQAMDNSSTRLESVTLYTDLPHHNHYRQQLKCLETSRQIKPIQSLHIAKLLGSKGGDQLSRLLMPSFSQRASQLVTLDLTNHDFVNPFTGVFLVDILTNFPLLESLCINSCRFGPESDDYVKHIQSSRLQATRLKKLDLDIEGMDEVWDDFEDPLPVIANVNPSSRNCLICTPYWKYLS